MKKWHYESASDLDLGLSERLRRFPREPDMTMYAIRSILGLLIRAALRVYARFEIVGQENLRTNRSLVLVANHCSHLDTVCLLAALPLRKLHCAYAAAASDYFFKTVVRSWFAAVICNAFPFQRDTRSRRSLSLCAELVSEPGTILIIFPEGTRSTDGKLQEFKSGIGAIVAGRDVAVIPCYLDGTFRVWPKGKWLPRPGRVRLFVGQARNYAERTNQRDEVEAIAQELHDAIVRVGQDHATAG